ncbi:MAG: hypothetical protein HW376_1776 [candidate division NC10 bacterium]|nr:hypothetical protein [candidate division NC10 bacterium]
MLPDAGWRPGARGPRRLTASRFAQHPCGGAARPAKTSIAPKPNTGLAGIGRRSPERSGGGSIALLGGSDSAPRCAVRLTAGATRRGVGTELV